MFAITASASAAPLAAPELPVRSPQTSIILAELARQRRWERQQRRKARLRRAAWLTLFSQKPFRLVSAQPPPNVTFAGAMPMVYELPRVW
jgi:hypothetical protein